MNNTKRFTYVADNILKAFDSNNDSRLADTAILIDYYYAIHKLNDNEYQLLSLLCFNARLVLFEEELDMLANL